MKNNDDKNLEKIHKEHEKVRSELIAHFKELTKDRSIVQTKHLKRAVYKFIYKRVFKDIKKAKRKKIDKYTWELFKKTTDWVLIYGYIIMETLRIAREYEDFIDKELEDRKIRMHKIDDDKVDA